MERVSCVAACAVVIVAATGCNSPAGMAVQLVGKAVADINTDKLGEELIGKAPSAADQKFGQAPIDTWHQVGGSRDWRIYPVAMDVLGNQRYVVQVSQGKIVAITMVKIDGSGIDLARKLMYDQKVQGKTPSECQTALNMGAPMVTAKSAKTGLMCQLYDAKIIPGVGSPQYCRVHYGANERCDEVALMDVSASTKDDPTR